MQAEAFDIANAFGKQRQPGQQNVFVARRHPLKRRRAPFQVTVFGLRVDLVGEALAQPANQRQGIDDGRNPLAMQPGLAEERGDLQVLAARGEHVAGQQFEPVPVGALDLGGGPDALGQAGVVFAAQFFHARGGSVEVQVRTARQVAANRFEQLADPLGKAGCSHW